MINKEFEAIVIKIYNYLLTIVGGGISLYIYITKIWYNKFMDENKFVRLRVLERTEEMLNEAVEQKVTPKFVHPNQTNPIYKNLMKFHNSKIGDKFSVKDLLW